MARGADQQQAFRMLSLDPDLRSVPVIDIRDGGTIRYVRDAYLRVRALRDDCIVWFPAAVVPFMPVLDYVTRRWLTRSCSPYIAEIESIAASLGFPGVWFLNGCYQWGCTALIREEDGFPWLARTLDWPFPGLGRHVEMVRMQGPAGDFFSVGWPGYVGLLTGMAPGRFSACINQAPLLRRTHHPLLRIYDIAANAVNTWHIRHIPPDQLLRKAFENCRNFDEARQLLEITPIARPVIYTLAGCRLGERCVIERTEEGHATRYDTTVAANDWSGRLEHWEARVGGDMVLTCSSAEAAENSRQRCDALAGWSGSFARDSFGWVIEPVLNRYTRIAVEMCAGAGELRVLGYEKARDCDSVRPATHVGEVRAAPAV